MSKNKGNGGNGNGGGRDGDGGNGDGGNDDDGIGYGKPPKHTRWKKGQSGNPRGPKKGSRSLKKDLSKALEAKHSIRVGGKLMRGTTQELALYTLAMRAAAGDLRASKQLIDLTLQVFGPEDRGGERKTLPQQDQELLDRLFEDMSPEDPEQSGDNEREAEGDAASDPADEDKHDHNDEDGESRDDA